MLGMATQETVKLRTRAVPQFCLLTQGFLVSLTLTSVSMNLTIAGITAGISLTNDAFTSAVL
jgi:hypothetical protein